MRPSPNHWHHEPTKESPTQIPIATTTAIATTMKRPDRRWRWWATPFLLLPVPTILLLLFSPHSPLATTQDPSLDSLSPPPPPPPRLFYFISGTAHDGPRLKRILLATYHPANQYLLHLDLAAGDDERTDLVRFVGEDRVMREVGNVKVMEDADRVTEKGPTLVACLLHAVARMMRHGKEWDWFVNLGAEDYPLMPQDDILHMFSYLPRDLNFIEHTSEIGWKESQRVRPIIVDPGLYGSKRKNVFWIKERRTLPASFKPFFGSSGMVLTRSFLEFCVWGWDNLPRTLLMYYTNFLLSPEAYFHSVICNSKNFQNTTVNHDLRFATWDDPPQQQSSNITENDFELMVESGAPFVHQLPSSSILVDRIDRELLRRPADRITPNGWCIGRKALGGNPCTVVGNPAILRPAAGSRRLEKLLMKVLDPEIFRSRQCK